MLFDTFLTIKDVMHVIFEITIYVNIAVIVFTNLMYLNQYIHGIIGVLTKRKVWPDAKANHKYAYIIACRNEEKVIGHLIDSIYKQDYPKELMKVIVIADNCTDNTAIISKNHGAIVFERFDDVNIGKSYALEFVFNKIMEDSTFDDIEAFIIFDADNLVNANFTKEMNKLYDANVKVATSFRDSKNYNSSWLAAGQSMSFYREHLLIHHSRSRLNIGTYVSGTGFFVDRNIIKEFGGWNFHTLIEDIEFSIACGLKDIKIGYCEDAIFYDEQPVKLKTSMTQRLRWCKGVLQCFNKYLIPSLKKLFKKPTLTSLGLLLHVTPTHVVSFVWTIIYLLLNLVFALTGVITMDNYVNSVLTGFIFFVINIAAFFISHALFCEIRYGKKIKAPWYKQVLYVLTFPIFMVLYLPILFVAIFKDIKWEPINRTIIKSIDEIEKNGTE